MTYPLDQNLGTTGTANAGTATTVALTTTAAASPNTRIILSIAWNHATATIQGISGGGLTWVVDASNDNNASSSSTAVASADCPNGLALGTVITVTYTSTSTFRACSATSFFGLLGGAAGYLDTTGNKDNGAGTAWASANMTTTGPALMFAWSAGPGAETNAPTAPCVEIHDLAASWCDEYRYEVGAGTYTVSGAWSLSNTETITAAAAYKMQSQIPVVPHLIVMQGGNKI